MELANRSCTVRVTVESIHTVIDAIAGCGAVPSLALRNGRPSAQDLVVAVDIAGTTFVANPYPVLSVAALRSSPNPGATAATVVATCPREGDFPVVVRLMTRFGPRLSCVAGGMVIASVVRALNGATVDFAAPVGLEKVGGTQLPGVFFRVRCAIVEELRTLAPPTVATPAPSGTFEAHATRGVGDMNFRFEVREARGLHRIIGRKDTDDVDGHGADALTCQLAIASGPVPVGQPLNPAALAAAATIAVSAPVGGGKRERGHPRFGLNARIALPQGMTSQWFMSCVFVRIVYGNEVIAVTTPGSLFEGARMWTPLTTQGFVRDTSSSSTSSSDEGNSESLPLSMLPPGSSMASPSSPARGPPRGPQVYVRCGIDRPVPTFDGDDFKGGFVSSPSSGKVINAGAPRWFAAEPALGEAAAEGLCQSLESCAGDAMRFDLGGWHASLPVPAVAIFSMPPQPGVTVAPQPLEIASTSAVIPRTLDVKSLPAAIATSTAGMLLLQVPVGIPHLRIMASFVSDQNHESAPAYCKSWGPYQTVQEERPLFLCLPSAQLPAAWGVEFIAPGQSMDAAPQNVHLPVIDRAATATDLRTASLAWRALWQRLTASVALNPATGAVMYARWLPVPSHCSSRGGWGQQPMSVEQENAAKEDMLRHQRRHGTGGRKDGRKLGSNATGVVPSAVVVASPATAVPATNVPTSLWNAATGALTNLWNAAGAAVSPTSSPAKYGGSTGGINSGIAALRPDNVPESMTATAAYAAPTAASASSVGAAAARGSIPLRIWCPQVSPMPFQTVLNRGEPLQELQPYLEKTFGIRASDQELRLLPGTDAERVKGQPNVNLATVATPTAADASVRARIASGLREATLMWLTTGAYPEVRPRTTLAVAERVGGVLELVLTGVQSYAAASAAPTMQTPYAASVAPAAAVVSAPTAQQAAVANAAAAERGSIPLRIWCPNVSATPFQTVLKRGEPLQALQPYLEDTFGVGETDQELRLLPGTDAERVKGQGNVNLAAVTSPTANDANVRSRIASGLREATLMWLTTGSYPEVRPRTTLAVAERVGGVLELVLTSASGRYTGPAMTASSAAVAGPAVAAPVATAQQQAAANAAAAERGSIPLRVWCPDASPLPFQTVLERGEPLQALQPFLASRFGISEDMQEIRLVAGTDAARMKGQGNVNLSTVATAAATDPSVKSRLAAARAGATLMWLTTGAYPEVRPRTTLAVAERVGGVLELLLTHGDPSAIFVTIKSAASDASVTVCCGATTSVAALRALAAQTAAAQNSPLTDFSRLVLNGQTLTDAMYVRSLGLRADTPIYVGSEFGTTAVRPNAPATVAGALRPTSAKLSSTYSAISVAPPKVSASAATARPSSAGPASRLSSTTVSVSGSGAAALRKQQAAAVSSVNSSLVGAFGSATGRQPAAASANATWATASPVVNNAEATRMREELQVALGRVAELEQLVLRQRDLLRQATLAMTQEK